MWKGKSRDVVIIVIYKIIDFIHNFTKSAILLKCQSSTVKITI